MELYIGRTEPKVGPAAGPKPGPRLTDTAPLATPDLKSTFLIARVGSILQHKYFIGILYLKSVLEYIVS